MPGLIVHDTDPLIVCVCVCVCVGKVYWETPLANSIVPDKCGVKIGRVRVELKMKKTCSIRWSDFEVLSEKISCTIYNIYRDTSINRTLSSVSNATFVYLTTSEMRTPHYSGHFHLSQMPHLCT